MDGFFVVPTPDEGKNGTRNAGGGLADIIAFIIMAAILYALAHFAATSDVDPVATAHEKFGFTSFALMQPGLLGFMLALMKFCTGKNRHGEPTRRSTQVIKMLAAVVWIICAVTVLPAYFLNGVQDVAASVAGEGYEKPEPINWIDYYRGEISGGTK